MTSSRTLEHDYLARGLIGMARAHRANAMAGHLGAALLAGTFFCEDHPELEEGVVHAVRRELDRVLQGDEALWFDPKQKGITIEEMFAPFEEPSEEPVGLQSIAAALEGNIETTRQSGHNVIFASLALRALHDHPDLASPVIVAGITQLIRLFDRATPGRGYYGKERGWISGQDVDLSETKDSLPPADDQTLSTRIIEELARSAGRRKQGFGGLFHLVNHTTALNDLARFGYADLSRKGWPAHHHHVRLWRSLPDVSDELGALHQAKHDPRTVAYWSEEGESPWSARLTHRIKTLYGFFALIEFVEDRQLRERAERAFLYLMA